MSVACQGLTRDLVILSRFGSRGGADTISGSMGRGDGGNYFHRNMDKDRQKEEIAAGSELWIKDEREEKSW